MSRHSPTPLIRFAGKASEPVNRVAPSEAAGIAAPLDPAGLDALLGFAADTFQVPFVGVVHESGPRGHWIVDAERCTLDTAQWVDLLEAARGPDGLAMVENVSAIDALSGHPLVASGPGVQFFVGLDVETGAGGRCTLCLADRRPRRFGGRHMRRLNHFATQVAHHFSQAADLAEAQLRSLRDPVTGLLNARGLVASLQASMERNERTLVASLRLLRFEAVADGCGNGKMLLQETARRLRGLLDEFCPAFEGFTEFHLASLDRGSFAVALSGKLDPASAATALTGRIEEALAPDFIACGQLVSLVAGVGLASADPATDGRHPTEEDGETLLGQAHLALADALSRRESGDSSSGSRVFQAPMLKRARESARLESDLRAAIDQGGVWPALQPIIDLAENRVAGFETLARWTHSERGAIPPVVFVPLAERAGLIDSLFERLATEATEALPKLSVGAPDRFLSLNLSKLQLRESTLDQRLVRLCEAAAIPPHRIHLELTESDVADTQEATAAMHRLRQAGFELMLDDFGTGTSTLASLHDYPVQWLKIDRAFTSAAIRRREVAIVADAVADLARKLKLRTIAEGLENADEVPMFQAMGYAFGQGYHFARPMSVEDTHRWLQTHTDATGRCLASPQSAAA